MGWLILALLPAMAARYTAWTQTEIIARDGTVYIAMARQLGEEPLLETLRGYHYHPLYPAAVAGMGRASGDSPDELDARGVSLAAGAFLLVALFLIAREYFGDRAAGVTTLLAGLAPGLTEVSVDALSDPMAVALALWAIVAALAARRALCARRTRAIPLAATAGLLAGLGYLTRPEELLAGAIGLGLLLFVPRQARARKLQLASAGALLATLLICFLPYAVLVGGLTQKKGIEDFLSAPGLSLPLAAASWEDWPVSLRALDALRRVIDRGRQAVGSVTAVLAIACWATWLGVALRIRLPGEVRIYPTRRGAFIMLLGVAVMFPLLAALELRRGPAYLSSRHAMLPFLLLAPCAGAGLEILVAWTLLGVARTRQRLRPRLTVALWVLGIALPAILLAPVAPHEEKGCYRRVSAEIVRAVGPDRRMLAPHGWFPFYAAAPTEQFRTDAEAPFHLLPVHLRSPEALAVRADLHTGQSPYELVIVEQHLVDAAESPGIIRRLIVDRRFDLVLRTRCRGEPVWVFAISKPRDGERDAGGPGQPRL